MTILLCIAASLIAALFATCTSAAIVGHLCAPEETDE